MSCCGKGRWPAPVSASAAGKRALAARAPAAKAAPPPAPRPADNGRFRVLMEYSGRNTLTIVGPATGRHYRFEGAGARREVDPRDRARLAAFPGLRQVRG